MTTSPYYYPQYRMTTTINGVDSDAPLAVRDPESAYRTYKGLQAAGIVDGARVYAPGDMTEPIAVYL